MAKPSLFMFYIALFYYLGTIYDKALNKQHFVKEMSIKQKHPNMSIVYCELPANCNLR